MARSSALWHQLFASLVVPALLVVGAVAYLADVAAQEALERALGARLSAVAQSAGTLVGDRVTLLEPGDDEARLKKNAVQKLQRLREQTEVARILVMTSSHEVLLDTTGALEIGDPYLRARFDEPELERVRRGQPAASVLFEGEDGRPYKTGYAPLLDEADRVVGYAAVAATPDYTDAVDQLRKTMGGIALFGLVLLLLAATVSARRVSVPLSALSDAAEQIGEGRLDTEIPTGGPREAVVLGNTMRSMTLSLRARDEEMQMMLAGIAHEVRNPLGGIELFGGLLKEDLEPDDPRRKHVEKILRELGVLARVVNDFLDFARKRPHEPKETRIYDLLFETISLAEKDAGDGKVKIELEADKALTFPVDDDSLRRALLNLLKNGIQATPEGGRVRASAALEGDALALVVEDDGPGIPKEKREEIFTPFFTTKQKGTGLGLALVKKTVVAHGGTIEAGAAPGGGARFAIRVPKP